MKRFPVDNMSPGRWKRICVAPDDSDSDSSDSSSSSVGDFYRRLYNFGDYQSSGCNQCHLPSVVCTCRGRSQRSSGSGPQPSSSSSSARVQSLPSSTSPMIRASPETDVEEDDQPQSNRNMSNSRRPHVATPTSLRFRIPDLSLPGGQSSSLASVSFLASTNVERSSPPLSRPSTLITREQDRRQSTPSTSGLGRGVSSGRRRVDSSMFASALSSAFSVVMSDSEDIDVIEPSSVYRHSIAVSSATDTESSAAGPSSAPTVPPPASCEIEVITTNPPAQEATPSEMDLFHAKLVSVIECPVCLEPIAPPVHQCRRGHLVCAKCKLQVTQCPTCRDKLSDMRNWAVERMAELLKYPCRNASSGCPVTALLTERATHELICPFRHYTCLFRTCSWTGFRPEMLPHLRTAHPLRFLEGSRQQIDVEMNSPTLFYTDWAVSCFGQVFRLNVFQHIPNSMFYASAYLVGGTNERHSSQFTYTVTVMGSMGRRVSFTRQTHPESTRTSQLCHSEDCFSIRGDKMEHFASPGGKLRLYVELEQLDQE